MTDVHEPHVRSYNMSRIKSKDTKPEVLVRKFLHANGFRFRLYDKKLPGKPDIVSKKYRIAIFVDGEFWHGYNWDEKKKKIKSNRNFWIPKIERNIERDKEINEKLINLGYVVFRFWEHQIRKELDNCVNRIMNKINK